MSIRRYLLCGVILFLFSGTLSGCHSQASPDLEYPNSLFSYAQEEAFLCDTWCPYDSAYLARLRENYDLDGLVAGCKTEFEKVQAITEWVTNLWPHDGDHIPEQSDPLFLLDRVTKEGEQYRCVEYGTVISGCLNALGIPTRTIGLKSQDMETREYGAGHVAAEAYLKDYKKWVFIDGQWGMIPLMGETPLNAVQLGEVLQHPGSYEESVHFLSFQENSSSEREYGNWIGEYLYYFDVTAYMESASGREPNHIMLIPIDSPEPTVFQLHYPLGIDTYTQSAAAFYAGFPQKK